MNAEECILFVTRTVVVGLLVLFTLMFANCQNTKYQIVQAIEAGATPLEAQCALTGTGSGCYLLYAANAERIRE